LPWGDKWNCDSNPKADSGVKTLIGPAFEVGDGSDNSRLIEALNLVITTLKKLNFECDIVLEDLELSEKEKFNLNVEME